MKTIAKIAYILMGTILCTVATLNHDITYSIWGASMIITSAIWHLKQD